MACTPSRSAVVLSVADENSPLGSTSIWAEPSVAEPSMKVTDRGSPNPDCEPASGGKVAVKVTRPPCLDGFIDATSEMAGAGEPFTSAAYNLTSPQSNSC